MAFKANTVIVKRAYDKIRTLAASIKSQSDKIDIKLASPISRQEVLLYGYSIEQLRDEMILFESKDVSIWAQEQESDPTYNAATEYAIMKNAINAVITEIRTTMPENSGYLAVNQFESPSSLKTISGTFAPAATANLRILVQNLSATIE